MSQLQTIFAVNRALCDSLERSEPALQRLCGKIAARAASGGRIFCIGWGSGVPQLCGAPEGFFNSLEIQEGQTVWECLAAAGITPRDAFLVADGGDAPALFADGLRGASRKGILSACIAADPASAPLSAAQERVCLEVQILQQTRPLKVKALLQMALDAVLEETISLCGIGCRETSAEKSDAFLQSAAAALMSEAPSLDEKSARELVLKYGSVRRAKNACKANVQK